MRPVQSFFFVTPKAARGCGTFSKKKKLLSDPKRIKLGRPSPLNRSPFPKDAINSQQGPSSSCSSSLAIFLDSIGLP